MVIAHVYIVII